MKHHGQRIISWRQSLGKSAKIGIMAPGGGSENRKSMAGGMAKQKWRRKLAVAMGAAGAKAKQNIAKSWRKPAVKNHAERKSWRGQRKLAKW
jgi:tartrate dehydratase alpha subunit/fumarate hydratase class I-like protein